MPRSARRERKTYPYRNKYDRRAYSVEELKAYFKGLGLRIIVIRDVRGIAHTMYIHKPGNQKLVFSFYLVEGVRVPMETVRNALSQYAKTKAVYNWQEDPRYSGYMHDKGGWW